MRVYFAMYNKTKYSPFYILLNVGNKERKITRPITKTNDALFTKNNERTLIFNM
jgi:hypothetical protein